MPAKLVLIAALLLGGCAPAKEPAFRVGDVVAFKLLPVVGVVKEVHGSCALKYIGCPYQYTLRTSAAGQVTLADEIELELLQRHYEDRP